MSSSRSELDDTELVIRVVMIFYNIIQGGIILHSQNDAYNDITTVKFHLSF